MSQVDKAATGIECNGIVECETTGLDEKKCSSFYRCKGFVTEVSATLTDIERQSGQGLQKNVLYSK